MSCHIAQGVTALLVSRFRTGEANLAEAGPLEAMLDLQFGLLSRRLNDPRSGSNGTGSLSARHPGRAVWHPPHIRRLPPHRDEPVDRIADLLGIWELSRFTDPDSLWTQRDDIDRILAGHLASQSRAHLPRTLDAADIWSASVLDLEELQSHKGFAAIDTLQTIRRVKEPRAREVRTLQEPVQLDDALLWATGAAPRLGELTRCYAPISTEPRRWRTRAPRFVPITSRRRPQ